MFYYIKNCLQNRTFRVKFKEYISNEMIQENGVPQGEINSVFFLIAINYMGKYIPKEIGYYLFADDLTIFKNQKGLKQAKIQHQCTLHKIE